MRQEETLLLKEYHCEYQNNDFLESVRPRFKYQIFSIWDFKKVTWLLWNLAFLICKAEKNNIYSWECWWLNKIIFIKLLTPYRPSINASAYFPSLLKLASPLWYCYLKLPNLQIWSEGLHSKIPTHVFSFKVPNHFETTTLCTQTHDLDTTSRTEETIFFSILRF